MTVSKDREQHPAGAGNRHKQFSASPLSLGRKSISVFTIVPVLQIHPRKYRKVHVRDPESLTPPRADIHPNHLCPRTALSKQRARRSCKRPEHSEHGPAPALPTF